MIAKEKVSTPSWCKLVRRYLGGNAQAGVQAFSSVRRWRRRVLPKR